MSDQTGRAFLSFLSVLSTVLVGAFIVILALALLIDLIRAL